jgi:hypothetical protein
VLTAVAEVTITQAEDDGELSETIDALVALQRRATEIERQETVLRTRIKEALCRKELRKFTAGSGHAATLIVSTTFRADKTVAERLLGPEIVSQIFMARKNVTLRVK